MSAPAGAGKTISLAQWAAADSRPSAWLRLGTTYLKIKVKVPKGTAKGKVEVTVKTVAGTSAAKSFTRL